MGVVEYFCRSYDHVNLYLIVGCFLLQAIPLSLLVGFVSQNQLHWTTYYLLVDTLVFSAILSFFYFWYNKNKSMYLRANVKNHIVQSFEVGIVVMTVVALLFYGVLIEYYYNNTPTTSKNKKINAFAAIMVAVSAKGIQIILPFSEIMDKNYMAKLDYKGIESTTPKLLESIDSTPFF